MTQARPTRDAPLHAGLLLVALVLGGLALVVDSPKPSEEDFENRVSAINLAEWLRGRQPGLLVVDLRSEVVYREYHLPQARRFTVEGFLASLEEETPSSTVVLYGPGDGLAAATARAANEAGYDRVYFLADGVAEWLGGVLRPTLDTSGTVDQQAEVQRIAELSRYFGGTPRLASSPDTGRVELALPRGGCGF